MCVYVRVVRARYVGFSLLCIDRGNQMTTENALVVVGVSRFVFVYTYVPAWLETEGAVIALLLSRTRNLHRYCVEGSRQHISWSANQVRAGFTSHQGASWNQNTGCMSQGSRDPAASPNVLAWYAGILL